MILTWKKLIFKCFIFNVGKNKVKTGLGLFALGAVTGNQQLQQTGQALTHLGLVTKGLAHLGKWLLKYIISVNYKAFIESNQW